VLACVSLRKSWQTENYTVCSHYIEQKHWTHVELSEISGFAAASMKMAVFWVFPPCSLVKVYLRFRGACCLHHQGDRISESTSETSINVYQITRSKNPDDSHLHMLNCSSVYDDTIHMALFSHAEMMFEACGLSGSVLVGMLYPIGLLQEIIIL
jgi:hypothetical protein